MGVTAIKRIHNLVPSRVDGGVTVTVRNAALNRTFTPDFSFTRRDDREVDWWIPWAWTEDQLTVGRQRIEVNILGSPGVSFSIWQQDDDIWASEGGSFAGARTRLGDINGDRRLVIFPDHVELIRMLDPLPPASTPFHDSFRAPYTPLTSGGGDVRASESGSFVIDNSMWVARHHSAFAGFGKRVSLPSGGAPIQIQALWDLSPRMRADGLGYASAQLILRLEAHPENLRSGLLEAPFVREQSYRRSRVVFGFTQPSGQFFGETPVLSLNLTQRAPTDNYVLRAFVRSEVGGFGWVNAEASCFGRLIQFDARRLL